jgi:hypothetical protein
MDDSYLDLKSKKKYQKDFKALEKVKVGFWALDDELVLDVCRRVNSNPDFQTLYSKYNPKEESYLFLAYQKEVELELFRYRIPQLLSLCPGLFYEFIPPRENLNQAERLQVSLACVDDPDYFRINHIRFGLVEGRTEDHMLFWQSLAQIFSY